MQHNMRQPEAVKTVTIQQVKITTEFLMTETSKSLHQISLPPPHLNGVPLAHYFLYK